jgi:hypothetical protein
MIRGYKIRAEKEAHKKTCKSKDIQAGTKHMRKRAVGGGIEPPRGG